MKTKKREALEFYQNLGKLFYAIAASDKRVTQAEINVLHKVVKREWLDLHSDTIDFGTDAIHQIEKVFHWLKEEGNLDAESCFNDFMAYKNAREHVFTPDIKKRIKKTAYAIANAFSGVNKSELIFLVRLDMELKK